MFSIIIEVFTFATKAVYTPSDQFSVVNKQTNKQTNKNNFYVGGQGDGSFCDNLNSKETVIMCVESAEMLPLSKSQKIRFICGTQPSTHSTFGVHKSAP